MKELIRNKTKPIIRYEYEPIQNIHSYSTNVFYMKNKSKAICNGHLVMASAEKIPAKIVVRNFIDRAEVRRKEGRYHDWFFRDNQFNESLIRLEAKETKQ